MVETLTDEGVGLSHVLLAPTGEQIPGSFRNRMDQPGLREHLLGEMKRLRGRVYLRDGAITPDSLTSDGRHASAIDDRCWHLLCVDRTRGVTGCARVLIHRDPSDCAGLFASQSALARSSDWGSAVRACLLKEMSLARRSGLNFVEAGGWAVSEQVRYTTCAARLALGVFAFSQLIGGAVAVTTATLRNHSAAMLQRMGGRGLVYDGQELPVYFDPQYGCDMILLRFDSESYSARYQSTIEDLRYQLSCVPVLGAHRVPGYTGMPWQSVRPLRPMRAAAAMAACA